MGKHVTKQLKKVKKLAKRVSSTGKHKPSNIPEKPPVSEDSIVDYLNLCTHFESHLKECRKTWKVTLEESFTFYKLDTSHHPKITVSIKINKNLRVEAFTENGKVDNEDLKPLLNSSQELKNWSQLKNLLNYFGNEVKTNHLRENESDANSGNMHDQINEKKMKNHNNVKNNLNELEKYLKKFKDADSKEGDKIDFRAKLEFILNQIDALLYGENAPNLLSKACLIYLKSSSCYKYLQSSNFFILPNEQDLLKYISDTNMNNMRMEEVGLSNLQL